MSQIFNIVSCLITQGKEQAVTQCAQAHWFIPFSNIYMHILRRFLGFYKFLFQSMAWHWEVPAQMHVKTKRKYENTAPQMIK